MDSITKIFLGLSVFFILMALLWHFQILQNLKIGQLPGDFYFKNGSTQIYFPFTTCLLIGGIFSMAQWIWSYLNK